MCWYAKVLMYTENLMGCILCHFILQHRNHKSQTQTKRSGKVRYLFSGCTSTDIYRPKYCGYSGNRCKTPTQTKTIEINFDCPNGQQFSKNFMWIKRCSTQYSSCKKDDDFFALSSMSRGRDVHGDTDVNHWWRSVGLLETFRPRSHFNQMLSELWFCAEKNALDWRMRYDGASRFLRAYLTFQKTLYMLHMALV